MAPQAAFEAAVVLRSAEEIAHQLPEHGATVHKLHHAGGDGSAEEGAAVEAAHDARGEFQFARECGFDPRRIFFGAAFRKRAAQELPGAHRVEKSLACE